ncbi:MAG TPA: ROK family protein [Bacillus sp. (in: firmicutes)]|uniref:ROK family protein n=1 Tax=Bacillus litorisediminis TaxID=2922713 RepID=UPI001FAD5D02|nr:ROK family protein [Bacillus litorisediminis]HWO78178.1 ROK family protein [Bacillus sp. (in: firmicutes)]
MKFGAIEAGGTKFVCAVGDEIGNIVEKTMFPTTTPEETFSKVYEFFNNKEIDSLGIGSFGPIDIDPHSKKYGFITSTPKPGWSQVDFVGTMRQKLNVPVGFDTDVNAAALGEVQWGAAKGLDSCLYMTVGTGIGVGAIVDGKTLKGFTHPEMGHILVRKNEADKFQGVCPYHGDCLEGVASGPAIEARWGKKGQELANDPEVWELEADYLAQALMAYTLILSPHRIVVGGGVMKQTQLFPLIRKKVAEKLNGYVQHPNILENIEEWIVPPGLGDEAGVKGALALAAKSVRGEL